MKKFLIALQYWRGDRDQAIELLDLLAETVGPSNNFADLCIFTRFDSEAMPEWLIESLKDKFDNVYQHRSKTQASGHPDGCNALWSDLAMLAYTESTQASFGDPAWEKYKAIFSIEADCSPIKKDWLEELSKEWDKAGASILGCWHPSNMEHPAIGHINGNLMYAPDLMKKMSYIATPPGLAWDTYHADKFKNIGWAKSEKILSIWNCPSLNEGHIQDIADNGFVFIHGVKDNSVKRFYRALCEDRNDD